MNRDNWLGLLFNSAWAGLTRLRDREGRGGIGRAGKGARRVGARKKRVGAPTGRVIVYWTEDNRRIEREEEA
jgi:hypothetical protein